jgi:putative tricarboxylic transport membrane protein
VGVLVLVAARGFVTSFPTDPLGPRAFPALAAGLFLVAALGVARRPGPPAVWPARDTLRRQGVLLLALASYAALVGPLGFVLTTALVVGALSRLFGARPLAAAATGALLAAGLWALFGLALGMPLPAGALFAPGR